MSPGAELIAEERDRQIFDEGWAPEHDAQHTAGELVHAAISYAHTAIHGNARTVQDPLWPFEAEWWKPSDDPVLNLVKAGALIAAEIDRIQSGR